MEHQPYGLAEARPFEGDTVELGRHVVSRRIEQTGDLRLQEIEIDRAGRQADRRHDDQWRQRPSTMPATTRTQIR